MSERPVPETDETRPLLPGPGDQKISNGAPTVDLTIPEEDSDDNATTRAPLPPPVVDQKWTWAKILWRISLLVIAGLVIAVFVKAWVDAGDVEVGLSSASL